MPRRTLLPLPRPVGPTGMAGIKDPATFEVLRDITRQLDTTARFVRSTVTPREMAVPQGPENVTVTAVGGTFIIDFQSDQSGPFIKLYKVYRVIAGNRNSPSNPGPDGADCIATMISHGPEDTTHYRYPDRNFTIQQLDPANPARWNYWVTSIDDRDIESAFVPASGSPIEALTNGPGDQSPELKCVPLNKIHGAGLVGFPVGGGPAILAPIAITGSTNAAPPLFTTAVNHGLAVGDIVAIDKHATNVTANGWWTVASTPALNTFTCTGMPAGGAGTGGSVYKVVSQPTSPEVADKDPAGNTADATAIQYLPWYSENTTAAERPFIDVNSTVNFPAIAAAAGFSYATTEVAIRRFAQGMRVTMSAYFANPFSVSGTSFFRFEVIHAGSGATLFSTEWDAGLVPNSNWVRLTFNFALGSLATTSPARLKFRFGKRVSVTGGDNTVQMIRPMVATGDKIPAWTGQVDTSDFIGNTNDPTVPAWSRTVSQLITRDASAPYI